MSKPKRKLLPWFDRFIYRIGKMKVKWGNHVTELPPFKLPENDGEYILLIRYVLGVYDSKGTDKPKVSEKFVKERAEKLRVAVMIQHVSAMEFARQFSIILHDAGVETPD